MCQWVQHWAVGWVVTGTGVCQWVQCWAVGCNGNRGVSVGTVLGCNGNRGVSVGTVLGYGL